MDIVENVYAMENHIPLAVRIIFFAVLFTHDRKSHRMFGSFTILDFLPTTDVQVYFKLYGRKKPPTLVLSAAPAAHHIRVVVSCVNILNSKIGIIKFYLNEVLLQPRLIMD